MRTLKKTLALVLVLAMMFSLCVTASAYTDDADIEYTEAVELLSALKVIEGYPDDSFKPDAKLNRAEAAVIIAKLNGYFDKSAATPSYTDMEGYGWANYAVAYCENAGIVNGTAEGIYEPGTTLTGYMFVKMLAVSMGVDADEAGMTGAAWQIGVTKVNKEFGITDGIEDMDLSAPITREQAAQCAYNALLYARDGYTWMVQHGDDKHYFTNEEDAILFWAATDGAAKPVSGTYTCTLGYEVFGLLGYADGFNAWGQPYHGWMLKNGTFLTKHEYAAAASWTTPVSNNDLYEAVAPITGILEDSNTEDYTKSNLVFLNGVKYPAGYYAKGDKATIDGDSGFGVQTFVYDTMFSGAVVVYIHQYIGKVTDVTHANAENGADRIVEVTNYCADDNDAHSFKLAGEETLNKGDVILYNLCAGVPCNFTTPETVSGSVTKVVNGSVYTIGETDYVLSKHHDCEIAKNTTATWYLDSFGNLMMKVADAKLNYQIGYLLAYDAQTVYEGDKMHEETYEASETYVIYDAEQGIIELKGEAYSADVDKDGELESYLPGQGKWVETKDAFTGDAFDIAFGAGQYNKKVGALSTGLVLYLTNEAGEIYWISDTASIDGNLVINEYDALNVLSDSLYLTGNKACVMGSTTEYYYNGLKDQTTVSAAVGYANAKKDVALPGEYVWNKAAESILAVSQHANPADEVPATGYLYVSDRFTETKTEIGSFDKYTNTWSYVTVYTYTGLYLDGKEIASYTEKTPLDVTGENIYKVDVYSDGTVEVPEPVKAETKVMTAIADWDADESYILLTDGTDIILGDIVLYYQLGGHAVAPVEGLAALSAQYDVVLYYIDTIPVAPGVTQTVVYFYVD